MFTRDIAALKKHHLLRTILSRSSAQGPVIVIDGKRYINFSSNDYLGLSHDPVVIRAAQNALARYGTGAGASRLLAGGTVLHLKLEKAVASFKGTEAAVILNSGYAANTGVIPAISTEQDIIFSDSLNHASIIDGCRLSRAKISVYRHKDCGHLDSLLSASRCRKKIVITDTVFSMDGDIAPLDRIFRICRRHKALLFLDDAHATGVLAKGMGGLAHFSLKPAPWIIQMGTFSKALGSFGSYVAGSARTIEWIMNTSRSLIFSTALPAPVIAASCAGLSIVKNHPSRINRLWANREHLVKGLQALGYDTMESETPIIPVKTADVKQAVQLSGLLCTKGIYAPAVRPPAVQQPRLRITVSALHTEKQINRLLEILAEVKGKSLSKRGPDNQKAGTTKWQL